MCNKLNLACDNRGCQERIPVFNNAHGGGNEKDGQDGSEKTAGILHLFQLHNPQAQGCKQQYQTVNGSGNGQRQEPLKGLAGKSEAQNDQKLIQIFHGKNPRNRKISLLF